MDGWGRADGELYHDILLLILLYLSPAVLSIYSIYSTPQYNTQYSILNTASPESLYPEYLFSPSTFQFLLSLTFNFTLGTQIPRYPRCPLLSR